MSTFERLSRHIILTRTSHPYKHIRVTEPAYHFNKIHTPYPYEHIRETKLAYHFKIDEVTTDIL